MAAFPRCVSAALAKIETAHGENPRRSSRISSRLVVIELERNTRLREPRHSGFEATRRQAGHVGKQKAVRMGIASYTTIAPMLNRRAAKPRPD
ncbi:hypothetical protein [Burkholderia sp. AU15512]|uniref:hypothetical protein n=1 Tax=Burkholderia sp. AU15512 TaxID=2015345 RepID=UPI0015C607CA|nr:hypothetical protein [Burkholderia sp. AU15512]